MNIIIQISLNTRKYLFFDDKKEVKAKNGNNIGEKCY